MNPRKPPPNFLNLDWEKLLAQLQNDGPNTGNFYMIVINKGQDSEYRTRFMTHKEAMEFLFLALEKKKLRVTA